jgi:hypothetical protein
MLTAFLTTRSNESPFLGWMEILIAPSWVRRDN